MVLVLLDFIFEAWSTIKQETGVYGCLHPNAFNDPQRMMEYPGSLLPSSWLSTRSKRAADSEQQGWHGWYFWRNAEDATREDGGAFPGENGSARPTSEFNRVEQTEMTSRPSHSHADHCLCLCHTKTFFFFWQALHTVGETWSHRMLTSFWARATCFCKMTFFLFRHNQQLKHTLSPTLSIGLSPNWTPPLCTKHVSSISRSISL
jgi:hypothetical protein